MIQTTALPTRGRLGPARYGHELIHDLDDRGRRVLVPLEHEQEVLRGIEVMRADGPKLRDIARRLNKAKIPARRDGVWMAQRISIVLQRADKHTVLRAKPHGRASLCDATAIQRQRERTRA